MKKFIVGLVLLLASWGSSATTYHVDCGAETNGAGTEASPRNTLAGITLATGDALYLNPDAVCWSDQAMTEEAMVYVGPNADGVTVSQYPSATTTCHSRTGTNCAVLDGEDVINIGLYVHNADASFASDIWARNNTYHNYRHQGGDTDDFTFTLARMRFTASGPTGELDNTYSILSKGTCAISARASNGPYKTTGVTTDVTIDWCARLGFDHRWWQDIEHHRLASFRSGYDRVIGGHGLTGHPLDTNVTDGWTSVGGPCPGTTCTHDHAVVSVNDNTQLIWDQGVSPQRKFQRVADDTTAPPEGYFSIMSGTTIRLTAGYAPSNDVRIIRQPIEVDCYDCEFAGHFLQEEGNLEGSGFHADNTTPMGCFNCYSYDNEGNGFFYNSGVRYWSGRQSACVNCIAARNGSERCTGTSCGKGFHATGQVDLINITSIDSYREDFSIAGLFNTCGVNHNILTSGGRLFGVRLQHDALTKCILTGATVHGSPTLCVGATCTEAEPKFLGGPSPTTPRGFCPRSTSETRRLGVCHLEVGCAYPDYFGRRARVPPDPGACQYRPGDP